MKFSTKNVVEDKKTGEYRLSHHLDLKTGMYKGRQVLDPKELGPPSVKSSFDEDLYFYIERKIHTQGLYKLGKRKILKNNVLIIKFDNRGLLVKKEFIDLNQMNDLEIAQKITEIDYQKTSFIYDFLSSMRQKVNDPLGKRTRNK